MIVYNVYYGDAQGDVEGYVTVYSLQDPSLNNLPGVFLGYEEIEEPDPTMAFSPVFPAAAQGSPYNAYLINGVSGGDNVFTFSITAGALPTGLSMDSSGHISGTPSAIGEFNFTVTVADVNGYPASQSVSNAATIGVTGPLVIAMDSLPGADFEKYQDNSISGTYSTTLQAEGGIGPYTWSIGGVSLTLMPDGSHAYISPAVPSGWIEGNANCGLFVYANGGVTGRFADPNTYSVTVRCTDSSGAYVDKALSFQVVIQPMVSPNNPDTGVPTTPDSPETPEQAGESIAEPILMQGGGGPTPLQNVQAAMQAIYLQFQNIADAESSAWNYTTDTSPLTLAGGGQSAVSAFTTLVTNTINTVTGITTQINNGTAAVNAVLAGEDYAALDPTSQQLVQNYASSLFNYAENLASWCSQMGGWLASLQNNINMALAYLSELAYGTELFEGASETISEATQELEDLAANFDFAGLYNWFWNTLPAAAEQASACWTWFQATAANGELPAALTTGLDVNGLLADISGLIAEYWEIVPIFFL